MHFMAQREEEKNHKGMSLYAGKPQNHRTAKLINKIIASFFLWTKMRCNLDARQHSKPHVHVCIFLTHVYGFCGNSNKRQMKNKRKKIQSVVFQRWNLTPHHMGLDVIQKSMIAQSLSPLIVFPFQLLFPHWCHEQFSWTGPWKRLLTAVKLSFWFFTCMPKRIKWKFKNNAV